MKFIKLYEDFSSDDNNLSLLNDDFVKTILIDSGLSSLDIDNEILEFDVAEALYVFRMDYNENIYLYHHINKILNENKFKPKPTLNSYEDLEDFGKIIYDTLTENREEYENKFN